MWVGHLASFERDERLDQNLLRSGHPQDSIDERRTVHYQASCLTPFFSDPMSVATVRGPLKSGYRFFWKYEDVRLLSGNVSPEPSMWHSAHARSKIDAGKVVEEISPHRTGFQAPHLYPEKWSSHEFTPSDLFVISLSQAISWLSGIAPTAAFLENTVAVWVNQIYLGPYDYVGDALSDGIAHSKIVEVHFKDSPVWPFMKAAFEKLDIAADRQFWMAFSATLCISSFNVAELTSLVGNYMRRDPAKQYAMWTKSKMKYILEIMRLWPAGTHSGWYFPAERNPVKGEVFKIAFEEQKNHRGWRTWVANTSRPVASRYETWMSQGSPLVNRDFDVVSPENLRYAPHMGTANRDPSRFVAARSFKTDRPDWMFNIAFGGAPLYYFFKEKASSSFDGNIKRETTAETLEQNLDHDSITGEPILDMSKPARLGVPKWCTGLELTLKIIPDVVDMFLDAKKLGIPLSGDSPLCQDDVKYVDEMFLGPPKNSPVQNSCVWAMARVDVRFGKVGLGCARHGVSGGPCCKTCSSLQFAGETYTRVMRLIVVEQFSQSVFTDLSPENFEYFLATQTLFDDRVIGRVPTVVGSQSTYVGAEHLLEYYTLQVKAFNPKSYRGYGETMQLRGLEMVEKWDSRTRLRMLNGGPRISNGEKVPETSSWVDISSFSWSSEHAISPFKATFHSFRQPRLSGNAVEKRFNLMDSYGTVYELCAILSVRCTGANQQFASVPDCLHYMKKIPDHKLGYCPIAAGNTRACRWTHTILAQEGLRPEVHCFHAGPHKPDPFGHVKCHDSQCQYEKQGSWVCDDDGCEGTLTHAGLVVEWMHVCFWGLLFLISFTGSWRARRILNAPEFAYTASVESKIVVQKVYGIAVALSCVAFLYFLIHLVTITAEPALLWRRPPLESLEPRVIEQLEPHDLFKDHQYSGDYLGKYTEPVFGYTNKYILGHLLFYMLLSGTLMSIIVIEWVGHRFYGSLAGTALAVELPKVGHILFVVFVSAGMLLPQGVMSLLVFLMGVTKLGYPEVCMSVWMAFEVHNADVRTSVVDLPAEGGLYLAHFVLDAFVASCIP